MVVLDNKFVRNILLCGMRKFVGLHVWSTASFTQHKVAKGQIFMTALWKDILNPVIPAETLLFSLYLNKIANSLFTYLKGRNF